LRASGRSWITVHTDPSFSILTVMKTSSLCSVVDTTNR
jgi:hypothetical protein